MDLDQLIQHIWGEGYNEPCEVEGSRILDFRISLIEFNVNISTDAFRTPKKLGC